MTAEKTHFMHIKLGSGYATIAIHSNGLVAEYATAFCSPKDQFVRRKGRLIAEGRLAAHRDWAQVSYSAVDKDMKRKVKEDFIASIKHAPEDFPSWVQKQV